MSKSAGGFWAKLQARSTTKLELMSLEERDRLREKGKRKARARAQRQAKHQRRIEHEREMARHTPLAKEARGLDFAYSETIAAPLPVVELPKAPGENKQADEVFIYGLADPRDHVVRYVGKTSRPLWERLREHEFKPSNQAVCEWLKALRLAGAAAEVVVLEVCKKFRWQEREIHWIAQLRKEHGLLNIAKGGKFYGPPQGKPAARATQRFHRLVIARSGPVKHLSREEIAAIYG
jgi:hypothetical protein